MPEYLEIEVALKHIKPKIWRRFLLPVKATFEDLHWAIQCAGPWDGSHLADFRAGSGRSGRPICEMGGDMGWGGSGDTPPPEEILITDELREKGDKCSYMYDFGDSWDHEVKLRKRVEMPEKFKRRLVAGENAWPPEDCGGPWGFGLSLLAVGAITPEQYGQEVDEEELEERREWLGGWDGKWDLEKAKKKFDR